jgi:mannose-1-phosphate guanylyltransferase
MFFFRARHMLDAIQSHLPELATGLARMEEGPADERAERERLDRVFPTLPSISIDHGVMEKAERLAVVAGSFGWNDVGSWQSAWELAPKDKTGNAGPEGTVFVEAQGNLVRNLRKAPDGRVIALVGVDDLVVVDTDDALLVIPRDRAQDVRAVLEILRNRGNRDRL